MLALRRLATPAPIPVPALALTPTLDLDLVHVLGEALLRERGARAVLAALLLTLAIALLTLDLVHILYLLATSLTQNGSTPVDPLLVAPEPDMHAATPAPVTPVDIVRALARGTSIPAIVAVAHALAIVIVTADALIRGLIVAHATTVVRPPARKAEKPLSARPRPLAQRLHSPPRVPGPNEASSSRPHPTQPRAMGQPMASRLQPAAPAPLLRRLGGPSLASRISRSSQSLDPRLSPRHESLLKRLGGPSKPSSSKRRDPSREEGELSEDEEATSPAKKKAKRGNRSEAAEAAERDAKAMMNDEAMQMQEDDDTEPMEEDAGG
ncbi:hypothetical protein R3P38DRAFT_3203680 [Favolaschia claudopus]|uniref:Uncharacterized protein n=1 Tax=Favolaschia claudopus TaxID=2862362 RepID=A0AAW0AS44_9AGAR